MLSLEAGIFLEALGIAEVEAPGVADGDGTLDDHHSIGINAQNQVDDVLYMVGVEEILEGVVVCGSSNDNDVGILVGSSTVQGCSEV